VGASGSPLATSDILVQPCEPEWEPTGPETKTGDQHRRRQPLPVYSHSSERTSFRSEQNFRQVASCFNIKKTIPTARMNQSTKTRFWARNRPLSYPYRLAGAKWWAGWRGSRHGYRRSSSPTLEQGPHSWPEAPAVAEAGMVDPSSPRDVRFSKGPRSLQRRHRQQASSIRLGPPQG